jgi:hypothetical protein
MKWKFHPQSTLIDELPKGITVSTRLGTLSIFRGIPGWAPKWDITIVLLEGRIVLVETITCFEFRFVVGRSPNVNFEVFNYESKLFYLRRLNLTVVEKLETSRPETSTIAKAVRRF